MDDLNKLWKADGVFCCLFPADVQIPHNVHWFSHSNSSDTFLLNHLSIFPQPQGILN